MFVCWLVGCWCCCCWCGCLSVAFAWDVENRVRDAGIASETLELLEDFEAGTTSGQVDRAVGVRRINTKFEFNTTFVVNPEVDFVMQMDILSVVGCVLHPSPEFGHLASQDSLTALVAVLGIDFELLAKIKSLQIELNEGEKVTLNAEVVVLNGLLGGGVDSLDTITKNSLAMLVRFQSDLGVKIFGNHRAGGFVIELEGSGFIGVTFAGNVENLVVNLGLGFKTVERDVELKSTTTAFVNERAVGVLLRNTNTELNTSNCGIPQIDGHVLEDVLASVGGVLEEAPDGGERTSHNALTAFVAVFAVNLEDLAAVVALEGEGDDGEKVAFDTVVVVLDSLVSGSVDGPDTITEDDLVVVVVFHANLSEEVLAQGRASGVSGHKTNNDSSKESVH
eukprot:m.27027 g.27027  ORF g.27027 m.27027 type:complete len:393 (+) comp13863_c0_seq1:88-1266(+)